MRSMCLAAALMLATSCFDFRAAEKTYCLENLDVCGIEGGAHIDDGYAFVANLTAGAMGDPYAPVPSIGRATFTGVLDYSTQPLRLGYYWTQSDFTMGSLVLQQFDSSTVVIDLSSQVGVVKVEGELGQDLQAGFVNVIATSAGVPVEQIGGPAVAPDRQLYRASLSGLLASPPRPEPARTTVALMVDPASLTAHFGIRSTLPPAAILMGSAVPGVEDASAKELPADAEDIPLSALQLSDIQLGVAYAVRRADASAQEIRGQFLPPGAALYVARMTGTQKLPSVPGGQRAQGMVVWSPDQPLDVVVAIDPPETSVDLAKGPAGFNGAARIIGGNGAPRMVSPPLLDGIRARTAYLETTGTRGQLLRPGEQLFFAVLGKAAGSLSPEGGAQVVLSADRRLCFLEGASPTPDVTSAHLHDPASGAQFGATVTGTAGAFAFTWEGDPTQILASFNNGTAFVDVHTAFMPGGELSGALVQP